MKRGGRRTDAQGFDLCLEFIVVLKKRGGISLMKKNAGKYPVESKKCRFWSVVSKRTPLEVEI